MNALNPIGILGGTFDPVHYGHLTLAAEVAEQLNLAEVRFIPAGTPPHRPAPLASPKARVDMLQLAISGNPRFSVDQREISRTSARYTVDTLSELRQEVGASRPLCLLLGTDAFAGLATWRRWEKLFNLAHVAIALRPGFSLKDLPPVLAAEFAKRRAPSPRTAVSSPCGSIVVLEITPVDISASMIREQLAEGATVRDWLPPAVLDYIRINHLYTGGG
ncbi:MAG TPA: nicotinate-nucleotide adenylyltransferase [Burkholderiales bacterium]|nr:nicotinate-nucleotide adenylyltransferase [Burkholderiales bacterium]